MSFFSNNFHDRGRKDRYYVDNPNDEYRYRDRDTITTITGPTHTSMTTKSSTGGTMNNQIDWNETSEAHVFKIDLIGVKNTDVKVEVEDDRVLCITGEKKVEKEEDAGMWHRVEMISGKFIRRISLPDDANADRVKADMNNGVLTITVPKQHFKKTSARRVQVNCH